jgi:tetratricopeptide (TPR) repeat protein
MQTYPRDYRPWGLLGGFGTTSTGQYQRSIDVSEKSLTINPDVAPGYGNIAVSSLFLNRLDAAEAAVRRGLQRGLDMPEFHLVPYFVAYLSGDAAAVRQRTDDARSKRFTQDTISHLESLAFARAGQLPQARLSSSVAVDIAEQAGRRERAALFTLAAARNEALYGNVAEARRKAGEALALARGRDVDYVAALVLALAGDGPRSRAIADDLARDYPEDTSVQVKYLPALRALASLEAKKPEEAVGALQTSARLDDAVGGIGFTAYFGAVDGVYLRGLALAAQRHFAEAATEFGKIVERRSLVLGDPLDALARLQRARALAAAGEAAAAAKAYDDLLSLWKDADPGLTVVADARAERARLR